MDVFKSCSPPPVILCDVEIRFFNPALLFKSTTNLACFVGIEKTIDFSMASLLGSMCKVLTESSIDKVVAEEEEVEEVTVAAAGDDGEAEDDVPVSPRIRLRKFIFLCLRRDLPFIEDESISLSFETFFTFSCPGAELKGDGDDNTFPCSSCKF
ncbi:unnamed protein product [Acanthosepion pharaonis]|uniref:Uncharacterized protein n=1 Tax=Acanthosepion pharaonis TaxID=158019 RepID=A0A812DFC9_ACAPH|nr:unnamed protein product [Sepia pharaonis]